MIARMVSAGKDGTGGYGGVVRFCPDGQMYKVFGGYSQDEGIYEVLWIR